MRYFANLPPSRMVLWSYLLWYLFFVARYFDSSSKLWLTSVGISAIIGIALLLSTWHASSRLASWTTFRLFLMPFCVSSFSALIKGRGFILVFSPHAWENFLAITLCVSFCGMVLWMKQQAPVENAPPAPEELAPPPAVLPAGDAGNPSPVKSGAAAAKPIAAPAPDQTPAT